MGCGSSMTLFASVADRDAPQGKSGKTKPKRGTYSSIMTLDSLDSSEEMLANSQIKRRHGHPTYFRTDGYDVGLRVRIKGVFHSTFVGCARSTGEKVSIKEHHLKQYPTFQDNKIHGDDGESIVVKEVLFLTRLSKHSQQYHSFPILKEMFITDNAIFLITDYIDPFRLNNFLSIKKFYDPSFHQNAASSNGNSTKTTNVMHPYDIKRIAQSLIQAIAFAHDQQIILRDINPQNIMIRRNGQDATIPGAAASIDVMIVDLALAVQDGSLQVLSDHPLFDWAMVPYLAPEAVLGHPYSYPVDIWSLGVLLYVMLSSLLPFQEDPDGRNDHVLVQNITNAKFTFYSVLFDSVDMEAKTLIRHCLRLDSGDRITAKAASKHNWLSDIKSTK